TGRASSCGRSSSTSSRTSTREAAVATRAEALTPYRPDWRRGRVASWVTTVDHKRIGVLYILTSLVFFVAGGIMALLMRAQLATPNEHFVTRNSYDELFRSEERRVGKE